jgi:hypothetical protein
MQWTSIRLELARTPDFPGGSVGRAYLLRLPLDPSGRIDGEALERAPRQATVRRFWGSEPDMGGHVSRTPDGWALSYRRSESEGERIARLDPQPLRLGAEVHLTEADGRRLPFRVVSLRQSARARAA